MDGEHIAEGSPLESNDDDTDAGVPASTGVSPAIWGDYRGGISDADPLAEAVEGPAELTADQQIVGDEPPPVDARISADVINEWYWAASHARIPQISDISVNSSEALPRVRITATLSDGNLEIASKIVFEGSLPAGVTENLPSTHVPLSAAYMVRLEERRSATCAITLDDVSGSQPRPLDRLVRDVDIQPRDLFSWAGDPRLAGLERVHHDLVDELNGLVAEGMDPDTPTAEGLDLLGELAGVQQSLRNKRPIAFSLLSSFVRPNHPAVERVAREAAGVKAELTGSGSFHAFQIDDPGKATAEAEATVTAVYEALCRRRMSYSEPPPGWDYSRAGQRIRDHGTVAEGGLATCMDTTVLLAAVLEHVGMFPVLIGIPGHIFVGYWRQNPFAGLGGSAEWYPDRPYWDSIGDVVQKIEMGFLEVIETTTMCGPDPRPAGYARGSARQSIASCPAEPGAFRLIDVVAARRAGISPLPTVNDRPDGTVEIVEYRPGAAPASAVVAVEPLPEPDGSGRYVDSAPPRMRTWKGALLTLDANSPLLSLKNTAGAQPLVLPEKGLSQLEDLLHQDREFELHSGFDLPEIFLSQERPNAVFLEEDELLQLLAQHKLFIQRISTTRSTPGPIKPAKCLNELRALSREAAKARDEKGMNPLFLTIGLLRWPDKGKVHEAPLILVPIRVNARARSRSLTLSLDTSSHVAPNYALIEWLRREHDLAIPELVEPQTDKAGIDVAHILSSVRRAIAAAGVPFSVTHDARLALLDLAAFRMWQDLSLHAETFMANPLVRHLVETPTEPFVDPAAADTPEPDLEALSAPVPADAAQLEAVAWAKQGRTFVLQGPPGTGKSQTITNMIAEAVSNGLRVMFVAEKQTALSVVQRRLNSVGLEPFALNLHHEGSSPALVRDQLKAALKARVLADPFAMEAAQRQLRTARFQLGKYPQDLHAVNNAGLSAYSARDRLLALGDGPTIELPIELVARDPEAVEQVRNALRDLQPVAAAAGIWADHPWRLAGAMANDEIDVSATGSALSRLLRSCTWAEGSEPALRHALFQVTNTQQFQDIAQAASPETPMGALLDSVLDPAWGSAWRATLEQAGTVVEQGAPGLRGFSPEVLGLALEKVRTALVEAGMGNAFTRKSRRLAAVAPVVPYSATGVIADPVAFASELDILIKTQEADRHARDAIAQIPGASLPIGWTAFSLGALDGVRSQLTRLERATDPLRSGSDWVATLRDLVRSGLLARNRDGLAELVGSWSEVTQRLAVHTGDLEAWREGRSLMETLAHHRARWDVEIRHDRLLGLQRWMALAAHLECLRSAGLTELREALLDGSQDVDQVEESFERGVAAASLRERVTVTGMDRFDSAGHDTRVKNFAAAQRTVREQWVTSGPAELLSKRGGLVGGLFTGRSTGGLARELVKTKQLLGTRALLRQHGKAVQELMPVTLTSPAAVVDLIQPGVMEFDLVIFDEASQITVPEAIGAMGRARAVVVVGDSRQMPPSRRVGSTSVGDVELEDDAEEQVEDQESILSECELARVPTLRLSWHYRSQDEALIAFSNRAYYEGGLSSFPTPTLLSTETGVELRPVKGQYLRAGSGVNSNTNPQEAAEIVADVVARIAQAPDNRPSLGIVTFNDQQRALIEGLLADEAETDDRVRIVLDRKEMGEADYLFVKPLEQVQGDERDVILFSVAFSRQANGKVPLNFGRLTNLGGERRLNVAVTRARRKNVVFCSFQPNDLEAERSSFLGVKHLKDFLVYAQQVSSEQTGPPAALVLAPVTDRHRDEIAVALRTRGMVVTTDVGLSDFRLDLLLSDPEDATRPILPVLLDGEAWRGRRTVSDRDVLPVEVLTNLMGWPSVARVWWPMWLLNRETAIEQVLQAFGEARANLDERERLEDEGRVSRDPTEHSEGSPSPDRIGSADRDLGRHLSEDPSRGAGGSQGGDSSSPTTPGRAEDPSDNSPLTNDGLTDLAPDGPVRDQEGVTPPPDDEDEGGGGGETIGTGLDPLPVWRGGPQVPVESADLGRLAAVLEEIVRVEGPMHASTAYRRYVLASGGQRLGKQMKTTFNQAMTRLVRSRRVLVINDSVVGQLGKTVYAPGTPPVIVHELGNRTLDEVPRSEVQELMRRIASDDPSLDSEAVKRLVLKAYGRTSLTKPANDYLEDCARYRWSAPR